jgi:hypothetical protein
MTLKLIKILKLIIYTVCLLTQITKTETREESKLNIKNHIFMRLFFCN